MTLQDSTCWTLVQAAAMGDHEEREELLRLRFQEGLPIREIASRWGIEASFLRHEYAQAGEEFKRVLLAVVAFHEEERECAELLAAVG